jgi:hypothetical protein
LLLKFCGNATLTRVMRKNVRLISMTMHFDVCIHICERKRTKRASCRFFFSDCPSEKAL